ncbi:hypothetical protein G1C96_0886 [Bifidobacterium sp. DSM 109958]|uniref:Lipoprotein n=1 Tax=Bifidobacterium moraviense TaxID=2675323 RepID=A0A7Y0HZE0_9BIFI|nr:hypothetical protein [Bifidobacterium sp. DSM 109958]NMN00308.1 hypothetical protein [Bifidobacterium sp. DSM 109958]
MMSVMQGNAGRTARGRRTGAVFAKLRAAAACAAAVAALAACGSAPTAESTDETAAATNPSPAVPQTATPYTPTEPEDDVNRVWVTVPDPPPAGYEEALARTTDPRVRAIFDDGQVTIAEERMANNLKYDCYAAAGIVVDLKAAVPMQWDGAHANNSYKELSEAVRTCGHTGPTDEWMTLINILVPH